MTNKTLWIGRFVIMCLGQLAGSLVATSLVTGLTRTAVLMVVLPLITTLLCTTDYFRLKGSIFTVVVGTLATFGSIHVLRMYVDAGWFAGPLPRDAVLTVYAAITIVTVVCAGGAFVVFSSSGVLRKLRWFVVGAMALSLIGLSVVARQSVQELSPSNLLRTIVRLEQAESKVPGAMQELSTMLAICGREGDAELVFRSIVSGGESQDSIALDQVMLRDGEKDFVLWVPSDEYEIRIYGLNGRLRSLLGSQ